MPGYASMRCCRPGCVGGDGARSKRGECVSPRRARAGLGSRVRRPLADRVARRGREERWGGEEVSGRSAIEEARRLRDRAHLLGLGLHHLRRVLRRRSETSRSGTDRRTCTRSKTLLAETLGASTAIMRPKCEPWDDSGCAFIPCAPPIVMNMSPAQPTIRRYTMGRITRVTRRIRARYSKSMTSNDSGPGATPTEERSLCTNVGERPPESN